MTDTVHYSVDDGIATITMNRPDKLNALNIEMYEGLLAALDRTDGDDDVRAVIVTGAGRAFCAGADLSGGTKTFDYGQANAAPERHRDRGGMLVLRIHRSLKPIIAAINGPPDGASSWFLPRVVGINQALEWCLSGRVFGADEALAGGLVRTVCPVVDVLPLRSEEHTSELQSRRDLVCRLLLEKKKKNAIRVILMKKKKTKKKSRTHTQQN